MCGGGSDSRSDPFRKRSGGLSRDRLHSYHKLQREQQWIDQRQDARASLNSQRRWKTIHKAMRDHPKR